MIGSQPNDALVDVDVVVIGGGPAGATTSALLAQAGRRVELFEREKFPRFHIGESLIPYTYNVIRRLGMLPKMKQSHFIKKYSVQFVSQSGRLSEPFYFHEHNPHELSQTWQVLRSEFDAAMLQNARDLGVQAHEQTRVLEVLFEGARAVGVKTQDADGEIRETSARVVVDASGQSSMIMDRLGLRKWDADLKKAALWTYWKGAYRDEGQDEGATVVLQTQGKKGWFWYIPLHDDIVSVGVVADHDYLFAERADKDPEKIYATEVERCPGLRPRLKNAERCAPFRIQKEYSYRSQKCAGDGWVMVGDAFGFLDPLYSSGVLLALKSGELAADAIHDALTADDVSEERLRRWEPGFVQGMNRMRRLVCEYYDGLSFGRFVKQYPHLKGPITDILMGNLFTDEVDVIWQPLDDFVASEAANVE